MVNEQAGEPVGEGVLELRRTDSPELYVRVNIEKQRSGYVHETTVSARIAADFDAEGANPIEDLGDLIAGHLREADGRARVEIARRKALDAEEATP